MTVERKGRLKGCWQEQAMAQTDIFGLELLSVHYFSPRKPSLKPLKHAPKFGRE